MIIIIIYVYLYMIIISKNHDARKNSKLKHENKKNRKLFYDSVPKSVSKMSCGVTPPKQLVINTVDFT